MHHNAPTVFSHLTFTQHNCFVCFRLTMMPLLGLALLTLTLSRCTEAFVPIGGGTSTHISITEKALLDVVRGTCRDVVEAGGHEFEPTVRRTILPELREPTSPHMYIALIMVTAAVTVFCAFSQLLIILLFMWYHSTKGSIPWGVGQSLPWPLRNRRSVWCQVPRSSAGNLYSECTGRPRFCRQVGPLVYQSITIVRPTYFLLCCVTIKYLLVLHITLTPRPLLKDEPWSSRAWESSRPTLKKRTSRLPGKHWGESFIHYRWEHQSKETGWSLIKGKVCEKMTEVLWDSVFL